MLITINIIPLISKVEPGYGGFILISWTGIILGILHSIMPCEDKAIFCFYAFGVARDWKQAFRIVNFYGLGLMLMNLFIGTILSYFGSIVGPFLRDKIGTFYLNGFASISLITSGIIMLIQIKHNKYWPHLTQLQDLTEGIHLLRSRKRTAFLLGLLAGIPPCVFELAVYIQGIAFSTAYGWGNGVWVFFFFGIGTWLGLIPLSILGTMSGRLSKWMQRSSFQRMGIKLRQSREELKKKKASERNEKRSQKRKGRKIGGSDAQKITSSTEDIVNISKTVDVSIDPALIDANGKSIAAEKGQKKTYSRIEIWSAIALIILGIVFLVLAILKIDIFLVHTPSEIPEPFD